MAEEDTDAVLSDVDDEGGEEPVPVSLPSTSDPDHRIRDLLAELDRERQARKTAETSLSDLQNSFNRLKVLAHEAIRKRDEAFKQRDESARSAEVAAAEKDEAFKQRDEALRQKESSRSEIETAAQLLVSGVEKISGKVRGVRNFSSGALPRSEKYTGLPAVAYGVVKRVDQIVGELVAEIEVAGKARDEAREQMEQRNYQIAIEVSEMEATITGLREEIAKRGEETEKSEKLSAEKDMRISDLERELAEVKEFAEECDEKAKSLQVRLDSQRKLVIEQLNYLSRAHDQICEIVKNADLSKSGQSEFSESKFIWMEVDMDGNLRASLEGTASLCELANVAAEKVRERMEERSREVEGLNEMVERMVAEKRHIGTLLKSALSSKTSEVRKVAEDGLREAGIDFEFNGNDRVEEGAVDQEVDEVYSLAGALENTVKASQIEITELRHLVEALRAESSLLKAHLDDQAKEIGQQKHLIEELEERERLANENVEGLMTDIAAAEEEIGRWKVAAEQEANAGKAIEVEFAAQMSSLRQELDEARQAMLGAENKLKFKEETAAAAMAARDAAEKSLQLADLRSTRLREKLEELMRQLEESDNRNAVRNLNRSRYACWPWQWLGLDLVRHHTDVEESSHEMELSEPLL